MIRITLAQMRLSLGRLIPAGIAITLGTAFVTFTLIGGNVLTRSTYDQVTAQFGTADLVVTDLDYELSASSLTKVRAVPGVTAADALMSEWVQVGTGPDAVSQVLVPTPTDPRLGPLVISEGTDPQGPDQIALPVQTAQRLGLSVGDQVDVQWGGAGSTDPGTETVSVVGVVEDPNSAWTMSGQAGMADLDTLARWSQSPDPRYEAILVSTDDPAATKAALSGALDDSIQVRTRDAVAAEAVARQTGETNMLVVVVLGFAAIALLVAALVIANTFQVLVAQRTRTLALLRCAGARRRQLRAAVVLEGALLGLVASTAGLLVGIGVSQGALFGLRHVPMGIPIPELVPLSVWTVVLPLLIGTLVTVGASLIPARAASAVPPIAALRPADAPSVRRAAGRIRLATAATLMLGGGALLAGATVAATRSADFHQAALWLATGVLGAGLSFVGVLVGAVFWMPRVVAGFGALAGRLGPASQLAAANARRNPRRTAATSAALLIGVTLVVTMSTGAATARHSLDAMLDQAFPVDLYAIGGKTPQARATVSGLSPGAIDKSAVPAVAHVSGVAAAFPVRGTMAALGGGTTWVAAWAVTPEQARDVLRDSASATALAAGQAVVPEGLDGGGEIALSAGHGTVRLPAVVGATQDEEVLIPLTVMERLNPYAEYGAVWARLAVGADPATVLADTQKALGGTRASVRSPAAERAQYERVIDVMLAVVVALLAVAVVIALIGVANTLSLSVLERRRESATLRSLGMTRRQLRGSLAVEGVLVAIVGSATGIVLGLLYGWAGSLIVFGPVQGTRLSVPWADLAAVVLVAAAAGLVASVLPARSAVRTPPVAALAME